MCAGPDALFDCFLWISIFSEGFGVHGHEDNYELTQPIEELRHMTDHILDLFFLISRQIIL